MKTRSTAWLLGFVGAASFLGFTDVLAAAGNCPSDACDKFGCNPDVQVVIGKTLVTEPRTVHPFTDPQGILNPTQIGAQVSDQATLVTWQAIESTTLAVPRPSPAIDGLPGTSFFIATSTMSLGGVAIEKPYVASSTYQPYTCPPPPTVTETSTATSTTTETSVSVHLVTTTNTETSTTTYTSTETSVSVLLVPTTVIETSTSVSLLTTTSTSLYCPPTQPPEPCKNRVFQPWEKFTLNKSGGQVNQFTFQTTNTDAPAYLTVTDADYRKKKYSISVNGVFQTTTSDFVADNTYCKGTSSKNGDLCIQSQFSWAKVAIPAGVSTVTIASVSDGGLSALTGLYKLEEKCT